MLTKVRKKDYLYKHIFYCQKQIFLQNANQANVYKGVVRSLNNYVNNETTPKTLKITVTLAEGVLKTVYTDLRLQLYIPCFRRCNLIPTIKPENITYQTVSAPSSDLSNAIK